MAATEIAHHIFFCVAALLMSDDDATLRAKCGQTARHGSIVGEAAIPMQLDPICKAPFDVVHGERPLRMPRDLHPLPRSEIAINFPSRFTKFFLNGLNSRINIDIMRVGVIHEVLQAPFQLKDRLFKIERLPVHETSKSHKIKKVTTSGNFLTIACIHFRSLYLSP